MAGPYYIYSGASGSGTGADWTNAFTSFRAMFDVGGTDLGPGTSGNLLASTDTIYVASDHADSGTYTAHRTIYGPASGTGVKIISADRTSGTPPTTFTAGTTDQFYVSGGAYNILFDGSFDVNGLVIRSGNSVYLNSDTDETQVYRNCTFKAAHAQGVGNDSSGGSATTTLLNCTFDFSSDTSPSTTSMLGFRGLATIQGGTIVQHSSNKRTGGIFGTSALVVYDVSGLDCSACGSSVSLFAGGAAYDTGVFNNLKMPTTTWGYLEAAFTRPARVMAVNCGVSGTGSADTPSALFLATQAGTVQSNTSIVRTGGASVEGTSCSWLMTGYSSSVTYEYAPVKTPWIYGKLATTGSKTFTVAAARDGSATAYQDDELWLEVEVLGTADSAQSSMYSDWRGGTGAAAANILSTVADQTTDGSSSWSGLGGTNKLMSLAVTAVTVGEEGLYRARVCFAPAASATVYVDPYVTVT